ncbi:MAG TPA: PEP-CTERM sorting domain-containing protein [Verrucomicrobiae bacterium]|nr:PEP-CTERM sorting domain-containing protein [Verrucomicrobiae bacterium]
MKISILTGLGSLVFALSCSGDSVLSPFPASPSSGSGLPFFPFTDAFPSVRYQQVYGAADFARVGGPFLITEIRFAGGVGAGARIDVNLPNVRIDFSTTSRNPDELSSVFADNVGSDSRVVYSGPLHFYDRALQRFDIRIPLPTPFVYDPHAGNLLMDVRNFQTVPFVDFPRPMEAANVVGDTVSRVYAADVNSASATGIDTVGLLTHFEVIQVPEPSQWALSLLGIAAAIVGARTIQRRSPWSFRVLKDQ